MIADLKLIAILTSNSFFHLFNDIRSLIVFFINSLHLVFFNADSKSKNVKK